MEPGLHQSGAPLDAGPSTAHSEFMVDPQPPDGNPTESTIFPATGFSPVAHPPATGFAQPTPFWPHGPSPATPTAVHAPPVSPATADGSGPGAEALSPSSAAPPGRRAPVTGR